MSEKLKEDWLAQEEEPIAHQTWAQKIEREPCSLVGKKSIKDSILSAACVVFRLGCFFSCLNSQTVYNMKKRFQSSIHVIFNAVWLSMNSQTAPFFKKSQQLFNAFIHSIKQKRVCNVLRVLDNLGIFLRIFQGISMENGASWLERRISMDNSQEYPFLKPDSTIFHEYSLEYPWKYSYVSQGLISVGNWTLQR